MSASAEATAPAEEPEPAASADLQSTLELWPAVVEHVRERNAMLAALLADARPIAVSDSDLTIAFPPGADFLKRKAAQDEHRRMTVEALKAVTGRALALKYELSESAAEQDGGPELSGEELVRRFIEEFDAEELLEEDPEQREAAT
jgi:hypothetical protein